MSSIVTHFPLQATVFLPPELATDTVASVSLSEAAQLYDFDKDKRQRIRIQSVADNLKKLSGQKHSENEHINDVAKKITSLYAEGGLREASYGTELGKLTDTLSSAIERLTVIETEEAFSQAEAIEEFSSSISRLSDLQLSPEMIAFLDVGTTAATRESQSLGAIWQELAGTITGKDQDMAVYAKALDKYTALYQNLTDLLSKLATWVSADGENRMKVDVRALQLELVLLLKTPETEMTIAGAFPRGGLNRAEANDICEKLGLNPAECIRQNTVNSGGDGSFYITPDLSQIRTMKDNLPSKESMSIAQYNVWKSGFDSQISRVEDALQARGQKYSNTYSRFENYHKMMSNIIQAMADMLKSFVPF